MSPVMKGEDDLAATRGCETVTGPHPSMGISLSQVESSRSNSLKDLSQPTLRSENYSSTSSRRALTKKKKHPLNLLAVVQRPNETTRKYIERFNAECKTIDGLVDGATSLCLTNGLANDDFRKQLTTKPVWTRKEMQAKAKEFIHHEEVNRVVAATKNQQAHTTSRGNTSTAHPRDTHRETLRGRTQNAKNKTLFCDYHQGYGHKTQDCYDLKDAIEQAIREGKLNKFIQIIREHRNAGRERSEGPETRNPRNLRDADEPMPIVPVITGASHTEKSRSANKKDLKILATVRSTPHNSQRSRSATTTSNTE
ncbi:hypothetical protein PIB30_001748 [Stylosanthes scabra]|uniref:Reverse transcriptase domain-containing protein n=1 Tax=Stylosanthes scabra TaxID=79078 RepID=A0ABU6V166_9FABA|nr:hypothetical protein [Stylosanthes scabra]